jgi:glycosyltransferase involved in cell wall biosynthesis
MFLSGLAAHLLAHADRYDLIHVHGAIYTLRLLRVIKPVLRFKLVYKATMCRMDDAASVARWGGPAVVDAVDCWACIASPIAEAARRVGVDEDRIAEISNGVDVERFKAPAPEQRRIARAALGVTDERRIVVSVGAVIERKRQGLLIEALGRMQGPRPLLLLVGPLEYDDAYVASIRDRTQTLGLEDDVRFLGARDDIPSLLGAADAFAFASHHEGSPNAVLEALATGLPVVSTVFESAADVVCLAPDRVNIVPEDSDTLAGALASTPSPGRVPAGMQALSLESVASRYVQLYDDVLRDRV